METYTFDLQRIFLGDQSLLFAVEIAFRTTVLYIYTLLLVRLIGKRGTANLSHFELVIVIALGSAVGDPMFYEDVPLLHGMVVVSVVVLLHRLLTALTNPNERLEEFVEGKAEYLVHNGMLDLPGMRKSQLSREEVFMELRHHRIYHLGQVKWAFIEIDGNVSVYTYPDDQIRPGLQIVPPWSVEPRSFIAAQTPVDQTGTYVCANCGYPVEGKSGEALGLCQNCQNPEWLRAAEGRGQ